MEKPGGQLTAGLIFLIGLCRRESRRIIKEKHGEAIEYERKNTGSNAL